MKTIFILCMLAISAQAEVVREISNLVTKDNVNSRVGINMASGIQPSYTLDVNGTANISGATNLSGPITVSSLTASGQVGAATGFKSGSTAGITVGACSATQSLGSIDVVGGLVTGGSCVNISTGVSAAVSLDSTNTWSATQVFNSSAVFNSSFSVAGKINFSGQPFNSYSIGGSLAPLSYYYNYVIGEGAGAALAPNAARNILIGRNVAAVQIDGADNICIGDSACGSNYNQAGNVGIGQNALYSVYQGGGGNVGVGQSACSNVANGGTNICIGQNTSVPIPANSNYLNIGNTIYGYYVAGGTITFVPSISSSGTIFSDRMQLGTPLSYVPAPFSIIAPQVTMASAQGAIQQIFSSNGLAADIGGSIGLGGLYTGTDYTAYGVIQGKKNNSTSGEYDGYMAFGTSVQGTGPREVARLTSAGLLGISTTAPVALLSLGGTGKIRNGEDTKANILATAAGSRGQQVWCIDCTTSAICVSTGAAAAQWADIGDRTAACN